MLQPMIQNIIAKPKCNAFNCLQKPSPIGHCNRCSLDFCNTHRYIETHNCTNYNKDLEFKAHQAKIMSNKCVREKITKL